MQLFERLSGTGRAHPIETIVVEQSEPSSHQRSGGVTSVHRAVMSQLEQQQRYSNKEVDENEGRNQVLSFTGKHHKRFNGSLLNSGGYEDDEDIASV
jgi:hypothetical protein